MRCCLEFFKKCKAYETALELQKEGQFKHFGISFHDKAEVLERILTEYPQIEDVQIQFNYIDYDDPAVQSRKCYEVCKKFGKPVIVMEPVKGGNLVNLPEDAKTVLDGLHGGSPASYAIRFAAGFDGIMMVLSGMSDMAQMRDNISYMKDFKPLSEAELEAVDENAELFDYIRELSAEKNATPAQISLACMINKQKNLVPIPGTRKSERLKENGASGDIVLSAEEVSAIDKKLDTIKMSAVFGSSRLTKG